MLCQLRPQFTEPRSALTVLPESPRGIQNLPVTRSILQFNIQSIQTANWQWLSMPFPQSRLWIKRIYLRYATVHEQKQHASGTRRVMRQHAPRPRGPGKLICESMKRQCTKSASKILHPDPGAAAGLQPALHPADHRAGPSTRPAQTAAVLQHRWHLALHLFVVSWATATPACLHLRVHTRGLVSWRFCSAASS